MDRELFVDAPQERAYDDGFADGWATARSGRYVGSRRRAGERSDDQAWAYVTGHMAGQDGETKDAVARRLGLRYRPQGDRS